MLKQLKNQLKRLNQFNLKRHRPEPRMALPDYSVLHIGPEHDRPMDQEIMTIARKIYTGRIAMGVGIGVILLGLMLYHQLLTKSMRHNDETITALIDEVGGLSQDNFMLTQQLESQEAVLKSIETEFTGVLDAIEAAGGDASAVEQIFGDLFAMEDIDLNLSKDISLAADDDTFDVLVLGTNGAHTDTIMVASINEEKKKVTMISVPRDLYVNGRRINEYYTYYGVDQLERMVQSVTGREIDKYAQVDLNGFVQVVDVLGGLDITVEEAIYDGSYPNGKGGYDPYYIEAGEHHMDGKEALKYARSRKSTSDFDRAARQQKILEALKDRILVLDDNMEMKEITQLFQAGMTYTDTNVSLLDMVSYYYDYRDYTVETGFVLSTSNYLYSLINESGAYILLPKKGNYEEIHQVIDELVH